MAKTDLLLDDWGLAPMGPEDVRDLPEILDDRVNRTATLITSQLPVSHWHDYLGEPIVADAILIGWYTPRTASNSRADRSIKNVSVTIPQKLTHRDHSGIKWR